MLDMKQIQHSVTFIAVFVFYSLVVASTARALILTTDGEAYQQRYGVPASMLPRLPSGKALKLFTSPNSGLLGGTVWPAAHALCTYLSENQQSLNLKRANCVELGSGTGAVGLFAAGLGASVVLTDCRPPPDSAMYTTDGTSDLPANGSDTILNLLERNVNANKDTFPNDVPRVKKLDWTSSNDIEQVAANGEFDLVLASDVTHFSLMHEPLACTISRMLRPDGGVCLLSHEQRMVNLKGQDMQLYEFEQVAESKGLRIQHLPSYAQPREKGVLATRENSQTSKDAKISMLLLRYGEDSTATRTPISSGIG